ncbi:apolipoprotein N-acyltransferase [Aeromicrobium sp.]|uniref:apolipoprotein N-acyltransferase n=1 Tax=Aeromicrobium sp. TaxID=1871063 RepID=UPI002FC65F3B
MTSTWARPRNAWLIAAVLGVVASLGFDPVGIPYAMVVSLAGLIWLASELKDARKRTVVIAGLVFGLAYMAPLIWWMNAVSSAAYIGLVILETLFFAPIMLALRAATRLRAWPLWGAAVWVAGEFARSVFPFTGFPWGRLAHTSIDTPFASYARLVAMPGTSAVLFLVAAMLLVLITGSTVRRKAGAALSIAGLVLVGLLLPTGIAGAAGTRQVSLVQGDVPGVFLTWPRGEIFDLHAAETDKLAEAIEAGEVPRPDMVLWPENSTDVDPNFDQGVRARIEGLSARIGAPILVGGLLDGPTVDTSYNAGEVWDANGPGDRYVKLKPVPFGEYVPGRTQSDGETSLYAQYIGGLFKRLARDIPRDMLAGDEPGAMDIANTKIGDTICYDIAYDSVTGRAIDGGAQLLVVQTSNAAFTGTSQPEQQWDISRLRAVETGRWVVVPSTNGISGTVDPDGNVVQRAPMHEPAFLNQEVELGDGKTPALRIGAPLEYLLVTLGLGAWFLSTRRKKG